MTDPHQRDLCAPQGHRLHKTRFWVYYDLWEQVINSPAVNISFMPREDGYSGNGWTLRVGSLLCRPLTRTGKLQCGTIPPSSRCKYGSNQQKMSLCEYENVSEIKSYPNRHQLVFWRNSLGVNPKRTVSFTLHRLKFKRILRHAFPCVWGAWLGHFYLLQLYRDSFSLNQDWRPRAEAYSKPKYTLA